MFDDINKEGEGDKQTPSPIPINSAPIPPTPLKEDVIGNEPNDILSDVNTGNSNVPVFKEVGPSSSFHQTKHLVSSGKRIEKIIFIVIIIIIFLASISYGAYLAIPLFFNSNIDENTTIINQPEALTETNIIEEVTPLVEEPFVVVEDLTQFFEENVDLEADLDTDGDGLTDNIELAIGTDIDVVDSDEDGLTDAEEVNIYFTNPLNPDTDNDTYLDGTEVANGYNPNGAGKLDINIVE